MPVAKSVSPPSGNPSRGNPSVPTLACTALVARLGKSDSLRVGARHRSSDRATRAFRLLRTREEARVDMASPVRSRVERSQLEGLKRRRKELLLLARARGTRAIYKRWWSEFVVFAQECGELPLPAAERTVELFVVWLELQGRGSGVRQAVAAIQFYNTVDGHVSPCGGDRVHLLVDAVERVWNENKAKRVRDPFPMEALQHWVSVHAGERLGQWIRDAFVVALGLRTMRRASELAALHMEDVQLVGHHLHVFFRRSKTDQTGRGFVVLVEKSHGSHTCPVRLWKLYLRWRGMKPGLLFESAKGAPLSPSAVSSICKRMVKAAGRSDIVSSHSLRIGGATAALRGGLSKEQIMAVGGWTSHAVERYLRAAEVVQLGTSVRMGL